ncbi:MAG: HEAT repeat domain-containing protein [Armatimonadetes bacterium]|nr:HEAT repeat domain-containing protein [Armatimonadota bacterium]
MDQQAEVQLSEAEVRRRTIRAWAITLAVIAVLVAYFWWKYAQVERLVEELGSKDPQVKMAAAKELMRRKKLVDSVMPRRQSVINSATDALALFKDDSDLAGDAARTISQMMKEPDQATRDRMSKALASFPYSITLNGSAEEPALLDKGMKDSEENIRKGSAAALGMIGTPALNILAKALEDADKRPHAGNALVTIATPPAGKTLANWSVPDELMERVLPYMENKEDALRVYIAELLGRIKDRRGVDPLLKHIDEKVPGLRRNIVRSLGQIADPRATEAVIRVLNEDEQVRLEAITALGEFRDARAVSPLVALLDSDDYEVRNSAITALHRIGRPAIPALIATLKNPNEQKRAGATQALEATRDPAVVGALVQASADASARVRREAVRSLGSSGSAQAAPTLVARLSDKDSQVAEAATSALAQLGAPAVGPLVALLKSPNNALRYHAYKALITIGSEATPALMAALNSADTSARKWAAIALGEIRATEARPTLEKMAKAQDPNLSYVAQEALRKLGGEI